LLKSNLRRTTQYQPPGTPEEPKAIPFNGYCQKESLLSA